MSWRSTSFSIHVALSPVTLGKLVCIWWMLPTCFQDLSFSYIVEEERSWEQGSNIVGSIITEGRYHERSFYYRFLCNLCQNHKGALTDHHNNLSTTKRHKFKLQEMIQMIFSDFPPELTLSNLKTSGRHFQVIPLLSYSSVTTMVVNNVRD